MKKYTSFILFSSLVAVFVYGCSSEKKEATESSVENSEDLITAVTELERKVNGAYYFMQDDEVMKVRNLELILDEIEKSGSYDVEKFEKIKKKHELLVTKSLKLKDLDDSELIDQYDALYREVSGEVIDFAEQHPNYHQNPDFEDLIILIQNLDARKLSNRVEYDAAAKEYNKYMKDHKENIGEITKEKKEKYGLFSLGGEE